MVVEMCIAIADGVGCDLLRVIEVPKALLSIRDVGRKSWLGEPVFVDHEKSMS